MDKKRKLIGLIDLIIIILILAVGAGSIYRFVAPAAALDQSDAKIVYTLRLGPVRDFTLHHHQVGLRVYERISNQPLGYISNVNYVPHYEPTTLLDGTVVWRHFPERYTVYLEITNEGRLTPESIYIEGTFELTVGSFLPINTKYVQVDTFIYAVDIMG